MNIVITGANGFIGNMLTQHLASCNHKIYALVHHLYKAPPKNITYRAFSLESFSTDIIPNDTDIIIHTAISNSNNINIDIKAAERLYKIAMRKKLKQFIYISKLWADENSISSRAIKNYAVEKVLNNEKVLTLKTAAIISNGGVKNYAINIIKNNKVIPLANSLNKDFQFIETTEFTDIIDLAIKNSSYGIKKIANENAISKKEFYKNIAIELNKKPIFINTTFPNIYSALNAFSKMGIDYEIDIETLKEFEEMKFVKCSII